MRQQLQEESMFYKIFSGLAIWPKPTMHCGMHVQSEPWDGLFLTIFWSKDGYLLVHDTFCHNRTVIILQAALNTSQWPIIIRKCTACHQWQTNLIVFPVAAYSFSYEWCQHITTAVRMWLSLMQFCEPYRHRIISLEKQSRNVLSGVCLVLRTSSSS